MVQQVADGRETSAMQGEAREAPRVTLLIRTAKLVHGGGEVPCIIRDVSSTGVRLRLFGDLDMAGGMALQLGNGEQFPLEAMWQGDGEAGFRFPAPIDVARFIEEPSSFPRRPVRLALDVPVRLVCENRVVKARLCDLSQQGARITTEDILAVGQKVAIEASVMEARVASVCWRRRQTCGLVFQQALTLAELAGLSLAMSRPDEAPGSALRQA